MSRPASTSVANRSRAFVLGSAMTDVAWTARPSNCVTAEAEGGCEAPARHQQVRQLESVTGQVDHGMDAVGAQRGHRGRDVAGVIHGVMRAEAAEIGLILTRLRGGDHMGTAGRRELHREGADAAGSARDEYGFAGLRADRVDRVERRGAGQAQRSRQGQIQPAGYPRGVRRRRRDVLAERAVAEHRLHDHAEHGVTGLE